MIEPSTIPKLRAAVKSVQRDFENGTISRKQAIESLFKLEQRAYELMPNAEPDGELTYTVANAVESVTTT